MKLSQRLAAHLIRHNRQVITSRNYQAAHLDHGVHPSRLRRACRSDLWGKRGRGDPGWRARRAAMHRRADLAVARSWRRKPRPLPLGWCLSYSAGVLADAVQAWGDSFDGLE